MTKRTDWSLAARVYPELREMPSYISQQRQEFVAQSALTTTAYRIFTFFHCCFIFGYSSCHEILKFE